jgi:Na+/H+ antiporter NhaD/arsenite permease-like protein
VLRHEPGALGHTALEYAAFLCLLGALYVISGGIRLEGGFTGTPLSNAGLLALGGIAANFVGTTGASMLLSFLSLAQHLPDEVAGTTHATLEAISCGAVFFGALTYIGNGPNFMVKSIAEHDGVKMPSFFGYVLWSGTILLPLYAGVTALFLRGA